MSDAGIGGISRRDFEITDGSSPSGRWLEWDDDEPEEDDMSGPDQLVEIRCVYFKPSGKWYTSGRRYYPAHIFAGCIYPKEYGKVLATKRDLPGLQGGWEGPFTIEVDGGYPELVFPNTG